MIEACLALTAPGVCAVEKSFGQPVITEAPDATGEFAAAVLELAPQFRMTYFHGAACCCRGLRFPVESGRGQEG
jgi:hypothetical protein